MLFKAITKAIVPALSKAIGLMPREVAIPNILDTLGTFIPPTLWTRTGTRGDIHDLDPTQFLGPNEGDLFCRGTRQTSGIVDTHTNLQTTVITDWVTTKIAIDSYVGNVAELRPDTSTTFVEINNQGPVTSGEDYTQVYYIKPNGWQYVQVQGNSANFGTGRANFDLNTCSVTVDDFTSSITQLSET